MYCTYSTYIDICMPELNTYPMIPLLHHHMKRRGKRRSSIRSALAAGMPTQRLLSGRVSWTGSCCKIYPHHKILFYVLVTDICTCTKYKYMYVLYEVIYTDY